MEAKMRVQNYLKKSLFLGLASMSIAHSLIALPSDPTVIEGDVTFTYPDAATITITSTSEQAIIDWDSFSNDYGETIQFVMPDENSLVLNRVTGASATDLVGYLNANGSVYLINENGITIESTSYISCVNFVGSTLEGSNEEFLAGGDMTFSGTSNQMLTQSGTFNMGSNDVVLLGYQIYHDGSITALGATVALGAGQEIVFHPTGSERISVVSQGVQTNPSGYGIQFIPNSYILTCQVEMKADGGFFEQGINHQGWFDIRGVLGKNGYAIFTAENGTAYLNGFLTNRNLDTSGGNVDVYGATIILDDSCYLDTSGLIGGGNINIGGQFQGMGAPFNSTYTLLTAASYVVADAGFYNDGGQIVVWSDDVTSFYGTINSRAGYVAGDGGLLEMSGVNHLDYAGNVDNTSTHGTDGVIMLDPKVVIYHPRKSK